MCPVHHFGRSNKRAKERLRFATFRVKCFLWTESPPGGPHAGFGFTADLSETGIGIYSDLCLPKGAPVRVAIEGENEPSYRGMVTWCQRFKLEQRFHGQSAYDYRIGVCLLFDSEAERQRYLLYFKELRHRAKSLDSTMKF